MRSVPARLGVLVAASTAAAALFLVPTAGATVLPPLARLPSQPACRPPVTGLGASVDAANALLAPPFCAQAAEFSADAQQLVQATLANRVIASGQGSVGQIGAKWGFSLSTGDVSAALSLPPPGFTAASLRSPVVGGRPGFAFRAPLAGDYAFGVKGRLAGDPFVKIGGRKSPDRVEVAEPVTV